jgi:ATP-dependent Lon protease
MENLKSINILMKNIIISQNGIGKSNTVEIPSNTDEKGSIDAQLQYFHILIQKTLLSVQKYKQLDIIGANELNQATHNLEKRYVEISNCILLLKNKTNYPKIRSKIEIIRNDIINLFKLYGTENIHDLLNVVFGDNYSSSVKWDNSKYHIIEKYFHPIHFKIIPWKSDRSVNSGSGNNSIEKNKIVDDTMIVDKSFNLDCFDLCRTNDTFQTKVYGIKIAFHNEKEKNTIIVSGLVDDLLISCIDNEYLNTKIEKLSIESSQQTNCDDKLFNRFIHSITLKELIVYSTSELINKYQGHISQILLIKQKPIAQVVKEFINSDLYGQRTTLIQLLLKSDEHEYQYLAYLLYDLLSNDSNGNIDTSEQTLLFDSLPWKIKSFFKEAMKQTITYTNTLSNFDNSKIPLEQQICLMKAPESVKEKAMNKLKEVKSKTDDTGSKARTYLDGLLKIPFGIYKKERVLTIMDSIKSTFKNIIDAVVKIDPGFTITNVNDSDNDSLNISNITNIQIKNICENIKVEYIENANINAIDTLISVYTPDKRNELIINICNINNIIKKNNIKIHKLVHSGKKMEFMKHEIKNFIESFKNNSSIIEQLSNFKQISNTNIIETIQQNILLIEDKWKEINDYMNSVKSTLNDAVHGHEKAKTQIERIIAQWINGEQGGYCFGFEGPPGTGKTTFAKKGLAKCLVDEDGEARPFSFIAIGGQDNGSTLNGHNYTYVGSEWGKFTDILIKNKCMNPIIFIDELDKVSKTEHGKEIIGILTHLIDSTQNDSFQDKYFNGIDLDLSKALFIFSYNDVSIIDRILLDRIHRIKFEHLTIEDKLVITRKHLLPEIMKKMGVEGCIEITDENIVYIVEKYTNEPGIRKFKELLFEIVGEINLTCLKNYETIELPIKVSNEDIKNKFLKERHENIDKKIPLQSSSGVINGLWANAMGQGGIIPIESKFFPSTSFMELKLTGLQGDVMKESMTVAKTLASSLVDKDTMKQLLKEFEETKMQGIHIHCPEGAVPKDGPSAGTAITCTLYSLLTKRKIKNKVAITGEINLQGSVTAIGGLDLKILGGLKGGVTEFIFPKENEKDYNAFVEKYKEKDILDGIQFHAVENIHQVLELIFEE